MWVEAVLWLKPFESRYAAAAIEIHANLNHRTGRSLKIRRVRFQEHGLRLVRRAQRKQDEAETVGYLGNVG
jgi:hypothetical protein